MSSPHIQTIRERISLGRFGEPVSAKTLNCLFLQIKKILDQAIEHENGRISHFEVSTCVLYCPLDPPLPIGLDEKWNLVQEIKRDSEASDFRTE